AVAAHGSWLRGRPGGIGTAPDIRTLFEPAIGHAPVGWAFIRARIDNLPALDTPCPIEYRKVGEMRALIRPAIQANPAGADILVHHISQQGAVKRDLDSRTGGADHYVVRLADRIAGNALP